MVSVRQVFLLKYVMGWRSRCLVGVKNLDLSLKGLLDFANFEAFIGLRALPAATLTLVKCIFYTLRIATVFLM